MRALYIAISALALSASAAHATCPFPKTSGSTSGFRSNGYHWTWNSDGYPHLVVTDSKLTESQLRTIRVPCNVMPEVITFNGRFAVVSLDNLGRSMKADVVLLGITNDHMDPFTKGFDSKAWQRQAKVIQQFSVPSGVARILAVVHHAPYTSHAWPITFVQKDGANSIHYRFERGNKENSGTRDLTITGDFRNPSAGRIEAIKRLLMDSPT